jgi:hypothetical protein
MVKTHKKKLSKRHRYKTQRGKGAGSSKPKGYKHLKENLNNSLSSADVSSENSIRDFINKNKNQYIRELFKEQFVESKRSRSIDERDFDNPIFKKIFIDEYNFNELYRQFIRLFKLNNNGKEITEEDFKSELSKYLADFIYYRLNTELQNNKNNKNNKNNNSEESLNQITNRAYDKIFETYNLTI